MIRLFLKSLLLHLPYLLTFLLTFKLPQMQKLLWILIPALLCNFYSFSQVGIGTTSPDPSSMLDIKSTTQGFLPPRMTSDQRDAIDSPAEGLFIYNLDSSCFQYFKGTSWSGCLGEAIPNALDCASVTVNGAYSNGNALNATNTITIDVFVNIIESYTITTNMANGYSFSGSGTFSSIGVNTVTLAGSGTPLADQTDTFTITLNGNDTCTTDISTNTILPNCLAYYNAGFTADGVYTIDPDGTGPNTSYDCYCDMTSDGDSEDGGGWTLVFSHDTTGGYWADDAEANEFNIGSPNITTNKYSILSKLDEIKSQTEYEFKIYYPESGLKNHWSQTFDPRSGGSTTNPVAGYVPIIIQMASNWGGLELSGSNTYLDGRPNSANWFFSIGSVNPWNGGIPATTGPLNRVLLFVR